MDRSEFSQGTVRRWTSRVSVLTIALAMFASSATTIYAQEATKDATEVAEAATDAVQSTSNQGLINLAIALAVFIVPAVIGSWLAKRLRMPDYGWKFAITIGSLAAAAIVIGMGEIKLGPDLSGGITLIYELDQQAAADKEAGDDGPQQGQPGRPRKSQQELVEALVSQLGKRVDPTGTKEVSIRSYGEGQIEIIIPKASPEELASIERSIYTAGALEFRIVASRKFQKHRTKIELAEKLRKGSNIVRLDDGTEVARWVSYDPKEFETPDGDLQDPSLVQRDGASGKQLLVLTDDGQNVKGDAHLKSASVGADQMGKAAVEFSFNQTGAIAFGELTSANAPAPSGEQYRLGILLDSKLLSAPNIREKITQGQGTISGESMTQKDVEDIVGILRAGSLPAALNKEPISREQISPTIGKETIEMGTRSIWVSLLAVLVFMVVYYRFAGVVACLALAANTLLILGAMVLIKGAFTLPGLAGLVLTVGMSVDANVLIYERIREELENGAALRMAIRNGFSRAMATIVDSNVSTLITAVVIYKIAPDNVKGFGVTLILGILFSMFTAVFMSRLVFDVFERMGWLKKLTMMHIVRDTKIDFMGKQHIWIGVSAAMILLSLVGLYLRGGDILNIDFTGGSSVTMVLDEPMQFDDVLKVITDETDLEEQNLTLVEVGDTHTRYTVTSVNQDVAEVEEVLGEAFAGKLSTYKVEIENVKPVTAAVGQPRAWGLEASPLSLVTLLQDDSAAKDEADAASADEADESADKNADAPDEAKSDSTESEDAKSDASDATDATPAAATAAAEAEEEGDDDDAFANGSQATLKFDVGAGDEADSGINHDTLEVLMQKAIATAGKTGAAYRISSPEPNYDPNSSRRHATWDVKIALPVAEAQGVLDAVKGSLYGKPIFPLASKIGGRVAGKLTVDAIWAILISFIGIVVYVWYRFNGVSYGLAGVIALVHDTIITLGIVAWSSYFVDAAGPLAQLLMVDKFQVGLPMVASILTLIGYSLNDTIVVFDRIREVKGKSPRLTAGMINKSINETLSRTLITSLLTWVTVVVLYILGGEGIHGFAFALLVGIIVGTYSSIYIASPILLWMAERWEASHAPVPKSTVAAGS